MLTCLTPSPRIAGSNPAKGDGFFWDGKIAGTSLPGGTLSWESRVCVCRLVKEPQVWIKRPQCKIGIFPPCYHSSVLDGSSGIRPATCHTLLLAVWTMCIEIAWLERPLTCMANGCKLYPRRVYNTIINYRNNWSGYSTAVMSLVSYFPNSEHDDGPLVILCIGLAIIIFNFTLLGRRLGLDY